MSYYNDHAKYGDFIESYSPNNGGSSRPPKKRRRKKRRLKKWVKVAFGFIAIILAVTIIYIAIPDGNNTPPTNLSSTVSNAVDSASTPSEIEVDTTPKFNIKRPVSTDHTVTLGNEIESPYAVIIDASNDTVLARRNADKVIYPASMTKVMTLLVAAENITDLNDTFEMTYAIIDPLYKEGLTLGGFGHGEKVKLIDMFYAMVLESGADAAVGLATYVAGSEEEFVKLMNDKCNELGLKNTHFTNASGMHNKENYTTCTEMAMIMKATMQNDFCREILTTEWYTVPENKYHKELKYHHGMLEKMYGTEPKVATIKGGKTGFTSQSLFCLVSFGVTDDGREIICVTAKGDRKYSPIYDAIKLYKSYTHPN